MKELAGRPSTKVIAGVAILLFADVILGAAIHATVRTGTCSSTGYTQYGPAPLCPKGTGLYGAFIPAGIVLVILASFVIGSSTAVGSMFVAIGVGSLLLVIAPDTGASIGTTFPLVFGGCFLIAGLAWIGIAGAYAWNNRPIGAPAGLGPAVAIAGQGLTSHHAHARPRGHGGRVGHARSRPRGTARPTIAAVSWAAAIAAGVALAGLAAQNARPSVDITRAPLPRPTGAAAISPIAQASLFRSVNLRRALGRVTDRFGSDADVVALAIYPGKLELVVAAARGQARRVTVGVTGGLSVGGAVTFDGSRQAVALAQVSAAVPPRLAREIARRAGVPTARLDRFVLSLAKPLAHLDIDTRGSDQRFEALLTGGALTRISPGPARVLSGNQ
jgi:hypothetical protein